MKSNLAFYNRDIGFLLVRDKTFEELCQRIDMARTIILDEHFKYLMASVLHQFAIVHSEEELTVFLSTFKTDFPQAMKEFEFIKDNKVNREFVSKSGFNWSL